MRTGPAAGHRGYHHEAACYGSDDELLAIAVPFLLDGVAAGEPAVLAVEPRKADLLRAALPQRSEVSFLTGDRMYARPAAAIRSYRELLRSCLAGGARQVRIFGEVPPAALGSTWDWWARYEAAVNHAYAEFPLWGICGYDTRVTPAPVLADVARTHPHLTTADGSVPSGAYTDPVSFLGEQRPVVPDPIQRTPPVVELTDPSALLARRAVREADPGHLPAREVDDLIVAVSETVTNTLRYGSPPVRVRIWAGADRIVVTVSDGGAGPKDPFAGLLPATGGTGGGLGLWISYQSCSHVTMQRTGGTFTVRLTAGNPYAADGRTGPPG